MLVMIVSVESTHRPDGYGFACEMPCGSEHDARAFNDFKKHLAEELTPDIQFDDQGNEVELGACSVVRLQMPDNCSYSRMVAERLCYCRFEDPDLLVELLLRHLLWEQLGKVFTIPKSTTVQ
ncbi:MAG: hypothetical protein ABIH21_00340 [Patescibacteria group bacterium]